MSSKQSSQATLPGLADSLFLACRAMCCYMCAGDLDCPSLHAYAKKYGDSLVDASGDLDVWFPRAMTATSVVAPVTAETFVERLEEAHDRLAAGGYEKGQQREETKARQRKAHLPVWLRKK